MNGFVIDNLSGNSYALLILDEIILMVNRKWKQWQTQEKQNIFYMMCLGSLKEKNKETKLGDGRTIGPWA